VAKPAKLPKAVSVESYFLRYAFPCTYVIKQRGEINDRTFRALENAAMHNRKVGRKLLESTYRKAFERMDRVAESMGIRSHWDLKVIREYFHNRHNAMIEAGDGSYAIAPNVFRELCKVHTAEIIEKRDDFFIVKYGRGKTRVVGSFYVPGAKKGDKVRIHHGFAVEMAE